MKFDTEHFSMFFITTSNRGYNDLSSENHWAKRFVESLAARGIVNDVADGQDFHPSDSITRGEVAIMVGNAFNLLEYDLPNSFNDVDDDAIYARHVASLYKNRIIRGTGNGRFNPYEEIKRQDVAIVLSNALLLKHKNSLRLPIHTQRYLENFDDAQEISNYASRHIAFLSELGILNGNKQGDQLNVNPHSSLGRAEMATLIYNSLQLKNIQSFPDCVLTEGVNVN